ncbi:MAG TPA: hypothetical protein VJH03_14825 [Blastocatellia bacterium]|nr:hypothetical protein [Blastocatellia bacterium]
MAICETQLWELIRSIEPTQTQKDGAARSQKYLREILNTGQMAARIDRSDLSGSYARDTAIYPLDDVDIIFVINPAAWRTPLNAFLGSSTYPTPTSVLDSFANAIRYRYPISSVVGQRRSVRLQLFHLDIDVVPAIQDSTNAQFIRIPDSSANQWILSSPLKHAENATAVNKFQDGKFKPLVKLLKYWNYNLPSTAKFKSFAIETMAVRVFNNFKFGSLQEGLRYFFDFIAAASGNQTVFTWKDKYEISLGWLSGTIPDAAGTGTNIIAGIDDELRKRFVENAIRSRNKIVESFNALSIETACRRVTEALRM